MMLTVVSRCPCIVSTCLGRLPRSASSLCGMVWRPGKVPQRSSPPLARSLQPSLERGEVEVEVRYRL